MHPHKHRYVLMGDTGLWASYVWHCIKCGGLCVRVKRDFKALVTMSSTS